MKRPGRAYHLICRFIIIFVYIWVYAYIYTDACGRQSSLGCHISRATTSGVLVYLQTEPLVDLEVADCVRLAGWRMNIPEILLSLPSCTGIATKATAPGCGIRG